MAYKIKNKKPIIEQETSTGWLTNVLGYFNKMTEEQKKALQSTITLCNTCKSDIQNKKSNTQSCVACKDFNTSMKNTKINESKKVKMTESQFNSVVKKLSTEQQTNKITKGGLLTERKYQCWTKGGGWFGGKCVHSSSILSDNGRPGDCASAGACGGMVTGDVKGGGKGTAVKGGGKTKYPKVSSKHIIKLKESDLINIVKRTMKESEELKEYGLMDFFRDAACCVAKGAHASCCPLTPKEVDNKTVDELVKILKSKSKNHKLKDGPQKVFNRTTGACNCGKPSCGGKTSFNSCVSCCKADEIR